MPRVRWEGVDGMKINPQNAKREGLAPAMPKHSAHWSHWKTYGRECAALVRELAPDYDPGNPVWLHPSNANITWKAWALAWHTMFTLFNAAALEGRESIEVVGPEILPAFASTEPTVKCLNAACAHTYKYELVTWHGLGWGRSGDGTVNFDHPTLIRPL